MYSHEDQISIQALYDYKYLTKRLNAKKAYEFQFKHCTIISIIIRIEFSGVVGFQFKHCTIISSADTIDASSKMSFQFKHCTIIRFLQE